MKRIGILGGSYNPIHVGHIQLAEHLLHVLSFDEVWLLVSPHNPLKPANDLLPDAIRYQWVAKSIEGVSGLVASDFEFALPQPTHRHLSPKRVYFVDWSRQLAGFSQVV